MRGRVKPAILLALLGQGLIAMAGLAAPAPRYCIRINLPAFRLYLFEGDRLLHDYPIAVGKPETPTPTGSFAVINKVFRPTWYPEGKRAVPPGPKNPIGPWWLGLSVPSYGIHGCLDDACLGQAVSKGCIRLRNRDVEQLAAYVDVGTPVEIAYDLFALREEADAGRLWLWIGRDFYGRAVPLLPAAMAYLGEHCPRSWYAPAAWTHLLEAAPAGWHEVPREVGVYRRELFLGPAYRLGGRIWLPAALIRALPGGQSYQGMEEANQEDVAAMTSSWLGWRYLPGAERLVICPYRLRYGEKTWEDAIKLSCGRVFVKREIAAALLNPAPAAVGYDGWLPLDEIPQTPWRWRWVPEEGEVILEAPGGGA